jgi:hypothetical protein
VRETEFKPHFDPVTAYSKMLSELTLNDERNRLIAADIAREAVRGRGSAWSYPTEKNTARRFRRF